MRWRAAGRSEIDTTPVRVAIVSPGPMRTQMRAAAFPGEDPETLPHPDEIGPLMVELARGDCKPPTETVSFAEWKAKQGAQLNRDPSRHPRTVPRIHVGPGRKPDSR